MTDREKFEADALAEAQAYGAPAVGPLIVVILPIVVATIIGYICTKLLDLLWERFFAGHQVANFVVRRLYVRPAIRQAMTDPRVLDAIARDGANTLNAAERDDLENRIVEGLRRAGAKLSAAQRKALAASAN